MISILLSIAILVLAVGVLGVGGLYLYRASRSFRSAYTLRQRRPVPIREAVDHSGMVELEGTVAPIDSKTVTAPFSGTDCLAYTYRTEERIDSSTPADAPRSSDGKYVILDEGTEAVEFFLEDETGRVRVDPTNGEFEFSTETYEHMPWRDLPEPITQYVESTPAVDSQDPVLDSVPILSAIATWLVRNDRRFVEGRIEPGQSIYVRGSVESDSRWKTGADAIIEGGSGPSPIVIHNVPKRATTWRFAKRGTREFVLGVAALSAVVVLGYGYMFV